MNKWLIIINNLSIISFGEMNTQYGLSQPKSDRLIMYIHLPSNFIELASLIATLRDRRIRQDTTRKLVYTFMLKIVSR